MNAGRLRPQVVSRALSQAGFERSVAETTAVRGWHRYTPGFIVQGARAAWEDGLTQDRDEDAVYVTICTIDSFHREAVKRPSHEVTADLAPRYCAALRAAGLVVSTVNDRNGGFRALRVTRH